MPIRTEAQGVWRNYEKANTDDYGKACVDVARRVMEILDEEEEDFDVHQIICRADDEVDAEDITGFMAGYVASMVASCHSRGKEFRHKWNLANQIQDEGKEANEKGTVLNPALISVQKKGEEYR